MSVFKLSNQLFSMGLDAQALSVYAYLCSIHADELTITGDAVIHVKQATIAQKCGIRSPQTVHKVIQRLSDRGLVSPLNRSVKHDGLKGTYFYGVKKMPLASGYFYVNRRIWGQLTPHQMAVYLFLCKSWDAKRNDCWNSYNDISKQIGMKRETVIKLIKELSDAHHIIRIRRRSKENTNVFVDNHYQIVQYITGRIKRKVRLYRKYNRTYAAVTTSASLTWVHYTTVQNKSQELAEHSFWGRGSP